MANTAKLIIITQPPSTFANQQCGKRHGFHVAVKVSSHQLNGPALQVELVYADDLQPAPNRNIKYENILQILDHPLPFTDVGDTSVRVRINNISRNHGNRKFRIKLSLKSQGETITCAYTTSIKVISKYPKRANHKRSHSESSSCSPAPTTSQKRGRSSPLLHPWDLKSDVTAPSGVPRASSMPQPSQTQTIGYGPRYADITIIKQPPCVFTNQQGGQKHGFGVTVKVPMQNHRLNGATLKVELVYDDLQPVPNGFPKCKKRQPSYSILQILDHPLPFSFAGGGETNVRVHINDVSRNHRGRKFRLKLSVMRQGKAIVSTHTTAIKVISKHPKRGEKNNNQQVTGSSVPDLHFDYCLNEYSQDLFPDNNIIDEIADPRFIDFCHLDLACFE